MEPRAWREQSNNLLPPYLWGPRRHVGWLANSGQKWKKDQKVRKNIQKTAVKRKSPCNRGPRLVMSVEVNLAWLLCCEWTMDIVAVIWENGNREFKLVNLKSDSSGEKCIWPDYHYVVNLAWLSPCCELTLLQFALMAFYCATLALQHAPCLPRWHLLFLISTTPCSKCILTFFLDLTKAKLHISLFLNLKICFYACDICWIIWKVFTLKESESENPNIVLSCLPWMAFIVLGAS